MGLCLGVSLNAFWKSNSFIHEQNIWNAPNMKSIVSSIVLPG